MARKLVCGVGINDADYVACPKLFIDGKWKSDLDNQCLFYQYWTDMLKRCYSERIKIIRPTYADCTVCDEWLTFSNFRAWMETQNWEGKHLDKDLLIEGNRVYSHDACVFLEKRINSFLTTRKSLRGDCMLGVNRGKKYNEIRAEGAGVCLGLFKTELEAHIAYLEHKLKRVEVFLSEVDDVRVVKGLLRIKAKIEWHIANKIELTSF